MTDRHPSIKELTELKRDWESALNFHRARAIALESALATVSAELGSRCERLAARELELLKSGTALALENQALRAQLRLEPKEPT